jgi:hypothetical protein
VNLLCRIGLHRWHHWSDGWTRECGNCRGMKKGGRHIKYPDEHGRWVLDYPDRSPFWRGFCTGYGQACKWLSPVWFALVAYLIWKHL